MNMNRRSPQTVQYSIGQVCDLTGVPPHTLRRWERLLPGLLAPARTPGGSRRYSDEDIRVIRALDRLVRKESMSLRGARRTLEEGAGPSRESLSLAERVVADREVQGAIDAFVALIRGKVGKILLMG